MDQADVREMVTLGFRGTDRDRWRLRRAAARANLTVAEVLRRLARMPVRRIVEVCTTREEDQ